MNKSYSLKNQHQYSLPHQALRIWGPWEMAKVQGEVNTGNICSSASLNTPNLTMNYPVTSLEIVYHNSNRLTISSSVWKGVDSQWHPLLLLNHWHCTDADSNPIVTLARQGLFYFSNQRLIHPRDFQYSPTPLLTAFHKDWVLLPAECWTC